MNTVLSTIHKLRNASSSGVDLLSNNLLKKFAYILAPYLTHLINLSIHQGIYPDVWKVGKISAMFKNGPGMSINDINCFRPICMQAVLSKVLERIACAQLRYYLESNNILPDRQFGFRDNHSIEFLLHDAIKTISDARQRKLSTSIIFIDLSKCFDTLDHGVMLNCLRSCGILEHTVKFFESYLSNRTQLVQIGNVQSNILPTGPISCPQGTVCGPLLFLIYIIIEYNYMPEEENSKSIIIISLNCLVLHANPNS